MMTFFLIITGFIFVALIAAGGLVVWLLNDTCISYDKWRKGKLTPAQIDAALRYVATQSQEAAAAQSQISPGAEETTVTEPAEPQNAPGPETQIHHLVEPDREARAKAIADREARRQAEREAIQRDFPAWLVDLAEKRGLKRDYSSLQALVEWINKVLVYGQETGRLSVPSVYRQFRQCEQAPPKASSWYFFTDLLKALENAGLVQSRPGNVGRFVLCVNCSRFAIHETGDEGH